MTDGEYMLMIDKFFSETIDYLKTLRDYEIEDICHDVIVMRHKKSGVFIDISITPNFDWE